MRTRATVWAVCLIGAAGLLAVDAVLAQQQRIARPGGRRQQQDVIPKTGGADCASATQVMGMLPYVDSGDTCGAPAVVSDYNNLGMGGPCSTYLYPGPELIYRVDLGMNNDITVTLSPDDPADLGVFVVSDCMDSLSCVGFQDVALGGSESTVTFDAGQAGACSPTEPTVCPAIPAGSYWIYIDSFYGAGAASCGTYTLTVSGTIPVELMEFTVD